jgi:hypothetical protein
VISCPRCGRFVKADGVLISRLTDEITRVPAVCAWCGHVDARWTDYDELVDESKPAIGSRELLPIPRGLGAV